MRYASILIALTAFLLPPGGAFASSAGNTTGHVLKLGGGARQAAMGGASAAFPGGATAIFGNPAGMAFQDGCSVSAGRSLLFESVDYSIGAAACGAGDLGSFGAAWQLLDYGKITSRDNTGAADGSFSPADTVVSGAWGREIAPNVAFGAAVKRVMVKIENSGTAYAADAGVMARFSWFTAGAFMRNMGGKIKINEAPEKLPRTVTGGVGAVLYGVSIALDANSSRDSSWLSGGAEYAILQDGASVPVLFRAGYSTRSRTGGYHYTAGVGIRERSWSVDYALAPYGDLGLTHHFTASLSFGGSENADAFPAARRTGFPLDQAGSPPDELILLPSGSPSRDRER